MHQLYNRPLANGRYFVLYVASYGNINAHKENGFPACKQGNILIIVKVTLSYCPVVLALSKVFLEKKHGCVKHVI